MWALMTAALEETPHTRTATTRKLLWLDCVTCHAVFQVSAQSQSIGSYPQCRDCLRQNISLASGTRRRCCVKCRQDLVFTACAALDWNKNDHLCLLCQEQSICRRCRKPCPVVDRNRVGFCQACFVPVFGDYQEDHVLPTCIFCQHDMDSTAFAFLYYVFHEHAVCWGCDPNYRSHQRLGDSIPTCEASRSWTARLDRDTRQFLQEYRLVVSPRCMDYAETDCYGVNDWGSHTTNVALEEPFETCGTCQDRKSRSSFRMALRKFGPFQRGDVVPLWGSFRSEYVCRKCDPYMTHLHDAANIFTPCTALSWSFRMSHDASSLRRDYRRLSPPKTNDSRDEFRRLLVFILCKLHGSLYVNESDTASNESTSASENEPCGRECPLCGQVKDETDFGRHALHSTQVPPCVSCYPNAKKEYRSGVGSRECRKCHENENID